jgi:hypothetical protein
MAARSSKIPTLLLTIFCIMLIAVIWFELQHPPEPEIESHEASPPSIDGAGSSNPENTIFFPPLSQYGEIVERPLFLAERRPPEEEEPEIEEEEPENEYILLGVILLSERKAALIRVQEPAPVGNQNRSRGRGVARSGESKVVRLQIGEDINGWRLETVADDKVILRKGEQTKDVLLVRNRDEPVPRQQAAVACRFVSRGQANEYKSTATAAKLTLNSGEMNP